MRKFVLGKKILLIIALIVFHVLSNTFLIYYPTTLFIKIGSTLLYIAIIAFCYYLVKENGTHSDMNFKLGIICISCIVLCFFLFSDFLMPKYNIHIIEAFDTGKITFPTFGLLDINSSTEQQFNNRIFFLILSIILAPITEEIISRGILQKYLIERKGAVVGIFMQAVIFSITHCEMEKVAITFITGLLYGLFYYKHGRLWVPMICHAIWNYLCYSSKEIVVDLNIWFILAYIVAVVVFVKLLLMVLKPSVGKKQISS